MNRKTIKKLQFISLTLQLSVLLIILLITLCQRPIKYFMDASPEVVNVFTLPIASFLYCVLLSISFAISFLLVTKSGKHTKSHSIVFVIITGLIQGANFWISQLFTSSLALESVVTIQSSSFLSYAISYIASPIQVVATILFLFSLGGYFGSEQKESL